MMPVKRLLITLVVLGLAGCDQVIDTQPYWVGAFAGTYQPGNPEENYLNNITPPSQPITVDSRLVSTTSTRYDFEGTVSLNGETYSMTGYEKSSYGDLAYLQPQARGVFGNFVMNLRGETGVRYSICGATLYGSAGFYVSPEEPYAYGGSIITGTIDSWERCFNLESSTVLGTINELEKR